MFSLYIYIHNTGFYVKIYKVIKLIPRHIKIVAMTKERRMRRR